MSNDQFNDQFGVYADEIINVFKKTIEYFINTHCSKCKKSRICSETDKKIEAITALMVRVFKELGQQYSPLEAWIYITGMSNAISKISRVTVEKLEEEIKRQTPPRII